MKRFLIIIITLVSLGLAGCAQKEDDPAASFKNTVWGGIIVYKAETLKRVFMLSLDDQNNFTWEDVSGKYIGKWETTEKGDLLITFTLNGIKTAISFNGGQLKESVNVNHDHWTIKQLDRASLPPKDLADSKWLNEKKWDMTFNQKVSSVHFRKNQGSGVLDGGTVAYKLNGPVINGGDGHFGATYKATFFAVFISEKVIIGNMVYAQDLFSKPSKVEDAFTYLRQQ